MNNDIVKFLKELTDVQVDALEEILFIGAGNSATVISKLFNKKIEIKMPWLGVVPISEIPKTIADPLDFMVGIYSKIIGNISAGLLLVVPLNSAVEVCRMVGQNIGDAKNIDVFSQIGRSALLEFGNIIFASFINVLATITGKNLFISVPKLNVDMLSAIIDIVLIEIALESDCAVVLEVVLTDVDRTTSCKLFILPGEKAIETLIEAIDKMVKK